MFVLLFHWSRVQKLESANKTVSSREERFKACFYSSYSGVGESAIIVCSPASVPWHADIKFLVKRLRKLLADITFLEAYERTNRFLNVTVTAADTNEPPRMLNYMTAPNVLVWSAVACSSAFPGLFPAQELLARDRDGRFVKYGPYCIMLLSLLSLQSLTCGPRPLVVHCTKLYLLQHVSSPNPRERIQIMWSTAAGLLRPQRQGCREGGTMAPSRTTCPFANWRRCST